MMQMLTAAILAATATLTLTPATMSAATTTPPKPVVYLVPHQDDETLVEGASVVLHREANRPVWLVLATDGAATQACPRLGLDPAACTVERDREFRLAAHALGVPDSRIIIATRPDGSRYHDGALTVAAARAILSQAVSKVRWANGGSKAMSVKAPSWADNHPDHAALGVALRDSQVYDARFLLKDFASGLAPVPAGVRVITEKPANPQPLNDAAAAYKTPQTLGVGYLSVPADFDYVTSHPWRRAHTRATN